MCSNSIPNLQHEWSKPLYRYTNIPIYWASTPIHWHILSCGLLLGVLNVVSAGLLGGAALPQHWQRPHVGLKDCHPQNSKPFSLNFTIIFTDNIPAANSLKMSIINFKPFLGMFVCSAKMPDLKKVSSLAVYLHCESTPSLRILEVLELSKNSYENMLAPVTTENLLSIPQIGWLVGRYFFKSTFNKIQY